MMRSRLFKISCSLFAALLMQSAFAAQIAKQPVRMLFLPLADHYAALVAYEKYHSEFRHAHLILERQPGPELVRARFRDPEVDMALQVAPMAMQMFDRHPDFRWIGLAHRDGNAFAVNFELAAAMALNDDTTERKPTAKIADALRRTREKNGKPIRVGIAHPLATHTAVLYKFLRDNRLAMTIGGGAERDVATVRLRPADSPQYLLATSNRGLPAAIEQSLPWPAIAMSKHYGQIAWYSKDVMQWPGGHVECIVIAKDKALQTKQHAIAEIMRALHRAGDDIEKARKSGGPAMENLIGMIRRHVPEHSADSIRESLRADLDVINYRELGIDAPGLKFIMNLSLEAGMLKERIDIDAFADPRFSPLRNPVNSAGTPKP